MRILVFTIILMASLNAKAQKTLSPEAFQAHVRPILNGIVSDFYQMISLFPDFPKEIVPVVNRMDSFTPEKENLKIACPRILTKRCLPLIDSLRGKLTELEAETLRLQSEQKSSSAFYINSLSGMRLVSNFATKLRAVKLSLDNSSFLTRGQIAVKRETYQLIKDLDELHILLYLAVVEFIPFTYQEDFRQFFFNFVQPIQINVTKNRNYEFLNRNINSLNFSLNLLNVTLTKRNKKTPEGMAPYLSLIHNRWNQLLRYYY